MRRWGRLTRSSTGWRGMDPISAPLAVFTWPDAPAKTEPAPTVQIGLFGEDKALRKAKRPAAQQLDMFAGQWDFGDNGFQDGDEFDEEIEIDPFETFEPLPPDDKLKAGDRVMFSYMPDRWHEGTIQHMCYSGRFQLVDDKGKTHVFWPEQLRRA